MNRTAVFVDAGYLYSQSAVSLVGVNTPRTQLQLNESELVGQLKSLAGELTKGELLRIYWYDGAKNGMTVEQLVLADMADVKVRLGSINSAGEQKGVDSLLITDLIDLARNQAIADALIVTGDSDMRVGVQIAQSFGVRVHLIGLEPSSASQSRLLRQEADTVHEISKWSVARFMQHVAPVPVVLSSLAAAGSSQVLTAEAAAHRALQTLFPPSAAETIRDLKHAIIATRNIPQEHDRRILGTCRSLLSRDLTQPECHAMRKIVIAFFKNSADT